MNCSSKNIIHFYNFNLLISINFVECFISVTPNFFMLVFDWQLLTFPPTPLFIEIREEIKLILKRGGSIVVKQIMKKCLLNFQKHRTFANFHYTFVQVFKFINTYSLASPAFHTHLSWKKKCALAAQKFDGTQCFFLPTA